MRKFSFASLVIIVLCVWVTGCGAPKGTDSTSASSSVSTLSASPESTASEAVSQDSPNKTVTLNLVFWTNGPADKQAWDDIAQSFNQDHPSIQIKIDAIEPTAYQQVLKARLAGGEGPDIFQIQPVDVTSLAKGGYLVDLSNEDWLKELYPEAQKEYILDGKTVAVPLVMQGSGIFYNKDIFSKFGLKEPETLDELIAIGQKLKENNVIPMAMSAKDSWWQLYILYYATAEHVTPIDPDFNTKVMQGKAKFSENTGWADALNVYKLLYDKGLYEPNPLGIGFDQSKASFLQGKAAMLPAVFELDDARQAKLNLGFFNFPTTNNPDSKFIWGTFGWTFGLNAKNSHVAEAKLFMQWLFEQKNYISLLKGFKRFPVKPGIDVSSIDPLFPEMQKDWEGKTLVGSPDATWLPGVQDAELVGLQEMIGGKATAADVLKKMDEATTKAINNSK